MVAAAGAGAHPMHHKLLTAEKLCNAIRLCLQPSVVASVQKIAATMSAEHGVRSAAHSFHANLPLESMACELLDDRPATYLYSRRGRKIRLCTVAAHILVQGSRIDPKDVKLYRSKPLTITNERWDPLTGISSSGFSTIRGIVTETGHMIASPYTTVQQAAPDDSAARTTTKAVANFGKGFGKLSGRAIRGATVEIPLAVAEGMRSVPKLYGEDVQSHGHVTDVVSGLAVGGRNFVSGVAGGVSGLVSEPMQGMKKEGALGLAKGTGKGILGFATKMSSAAVGIVAYPGQGISKSLIAPFKATTRKGIMAQRGAEGEYMARIEGPEYLDVLRRFDALMLHGRSGGTETVPTSPYIV